MCSILRLILRAPNENLPEPEILQVELQCIMGAYCFNFLEYTQEIGRSMLIQHLQQLQNYTNIQSVVSFPMPHLFKMWLRSEGFLTNLIPSRSSRLRVMTYQSKDLAHARRLDQASRAPSSSVTRARVLDRSLFCQYLGVN